jgi:hypothetical protein
MKTWMVVTLSVVTFGIGRLPNLVWLDDADSELVAELLDHAQQPVCICACTHDLVVFQTVLDSCVDFAQQPTSPRSQ